MAGRKVKKEKVKHMKVYNVMIQFNDGTVYRELFESNALGNIVGSFRGNNNRCPMHDTELLLRGDNRILTESYPNYNGETVVIRTKDISLIKYLENKGCRGNVLPSSVYDWEDTL